MNGTTISGYRGNLAEAEKRASNGDEEAAKDAEAFRLWIDFQIGRDVRRAKARDLLRTGISNVTPFPGTKSLH
jgi:hypothetical protein